MNNNVLKHLFNADEKIHNALERLDELAIDAILFVVDEKGMLVGSLTDGDVRRGLLKGATVDDPIMDIVRHNPRYFLKGKYDIKQMQSFRDSNLKIIPVINEENQIVNVVNFRLLKSYLPIDAVIMAGGKGERLRPLTEKVPKSLLAVGDTPIIEHNINRHISFGIDDFWISIGYLGDQIVEYIGDGNEKNISVSYINELKPLGTIGALSNADGFLHDHILLMNADILTNIDYEDFYLDFLENDACFSVVTIPYKVKIPYAVLETKDQIIHDFKEKPSYTYYSNGGIYLMKKEVIELIPKDQFFDATDLMEVLIKRGEKVTSYPIRGYWLDIGSHNDFKKANDDINHIQF